jgi:hypothetical protein
MIEWVLVYEDGSAFSNENGTPSESPPWGILSVIQPAQDPPIMVNADWLMYREDYGEWTQCGSDGIEDHAVHFGHLISCFRKTRWTRTPNWREVWKQLHEMLREIQDG